MKRMAPMKSPKLTVPTTAFRRNNKMGNMYADTNSDVGSSTINLYFKFIIISLKDLQHHNESLFKI